MSDSYSTDESYDVDSDSELQKAFAEGRLKTGLSVETSAPKTYTNDVAGLRNKLKEFAKEMDWIERLDLTNIPAPAAPGTDVQGDDDVHNDFKREMLFYRQAQSSVLEGIQKLHKLGIPTKRPEDYFAEMAKSDDHMKKVREKLLSKQMGMERSEKAKKMRDLRKYGKKVQQEVLLKRQKDKREMLESVKKFRKGQKDKIDFLGNENMRPSNAPGKGNKKGDHKQPNQKRQFKNRKFGFGGQKKRSKSNTSESSASMSGYNPKVNSNSKGKPGHKDGKGKQNRPGKSNRQKVKNRKR